MDTLISSLRKYAYSLKWNYIIVYKFPKSMITHVPCQSFVVVGGCADTKHRPLTLSASHISFLTRTRRENTFENIAFTYDLEGIIRIQSLLSCNLIYSRFFIIICQILSFNILNASLRWLWKKQISWKSVAHEIFYSLKEIMPENKNFYIFSNSSWR